MLTSNRSQSQSRRGGRGRGVSFSAANIDMRDIKSPSPPLRATPPFLSFSRCFFFFYVGVGALGAPLHQWSPSLYKLPASRETPPDLRAPDIWARHGSNNSRLTDAPSRRRKPPSLRSVPSQALWRNRRGKPGTGRRKERSLTLAMS
ncbi:hypothetical protein SRHO_G00121760 [Serrasalmus rhombeus]